MSVEQFLTAVLPTQGHRFSLNTFGKQGDDDFRPCQKQFPPGTTTALVDAANADSAKGANAYFAVAGFQPGFNAKGKPYRAAHLAIWHRCLRIDVDVGPTKPYPTKRDALLAIFGMAQHYSMPKPWLVDSGGGIHVYWSFDTDVSLQDWLPMAGRLRAACEAYGLQADSTTTTDAARVLRVPGTENQKDDLIDPATGRRPVVRIMQDGDSVSPSLVVANLPPADIAYSNMALPAALRGVGDEFQANLHQPYFLRDMLKQCPGLTAMVGDGGARAQEPLWKAALDLINKSDDSDELKAKVARGISCGHAGFTEEGLRKKWQQVQLQNYHPPTCGRMQAAGMPECSACPMRGKISSPLVLGRPRATPAPSDAAVPPLPASPADPPAGNVPPPPPSNPGTALVAAPPVQLGVFLIDHTTTVKVVDGRLTSRLLIADGYPIQILDGPADDQGVKKQYNHKMLDYRLLKVERMLDPVGKRSVVVLSFERAKDGVAAIEFDNRDFAEPKSFYSKMNAEGLYCTRKAAGDFVEKFMTEFLTQLQRSRAASQIAGRCGWSDDFSSFVLGQQLYRAGGANEHIRTSVAPGEMEGYHTAGSEQQWRTAFDLALSGGVDRQCVLALAIAGPLMVFTGLDGVLLNAYSPESGIGKSTLCDAALSIWGSPNVLRKDFRDTSNATFKLAAVSGNMPMVIDEFTNVDGKALSDYVYTLTQGREKHRLTSDARLQGQGAQQRWCLAAITTANNSIHEKLQSYRPDAVAEAARVFEMRLKPLNVDPATMGSAKDQLQALRTCYGFLGPRLVELFLAKSPTYWRDAVTSRIARWDRDASQNTGDRFRSATCALIEIGAALGKALGFAFDVAGVQYELKSHWTRQVAEFEAERKTPADFLNAYVLKFLSEFAMIGGANGDQLINPNVPRRFMGEMRGSSQTGKYVPVTIMVPMDHLRDFVRDQNGNYKSLIEWLQNASLVTRYGRLTYLEGTTMQMVTSAVEFRYSDVVGAARLRLVTPATSAKVTA